MRTVDEQLKWLEENGEQVLEAERWMRWPSQFLFCHTFNSRMPICTQQILERYQKLAERVPSQEVLILLAKAREIELTEALQFTEHETPFMDFPR